MDSFFKSNSWGYLFLLLPVLFIGCHKNNDTQPANPISHNDSTAFVEILKDISKDNSTILDIPPVPLPDEFLNSDIEGIQKVVATLNKFNELIKNPQNADTTHFKSVEATDFTKNCETDDLFTECIYKEDHGAYQITAVWTSVFDYWTLIYYYSGIYQGIDYGDMYEKQDHICTKDGKYYDWIVYRDPIPPESAGEIQFFYTITEKDEKTIYTPWGTEHDRAIEFDSFIYEWDHLKKFNHVSFGITLFWEGNLMQWINVDWSINKEDIYVSWIGGWDYKEKKGSWCSYDDDGNIINCGKM